MSSTPIKPKAPKPEGLILVERDNYLSVQWRWFQLQHVFFAFFTLIWFSFLFGWYVSLSSFDLLEQGWFGLLFYILPLFHIAAGFYIGHMALSGLLNTTTIELSLHASTEGAFRSGPQRGTLRITHGPIPGAKNIEMPTEALRQFYCCKEERRGNKNSLHYQLVALSDQDEMKVLLKDLPKPELARYLEQKLEALLAIEDTSVMGEMPK
jgi:hypothetical protein